MKISEIWRYPVKTMAGEKLQHAAVGPLGIDGDRIVHVEDGTGRVITSRSHPGFLGHKATLGADGEPLVDGRPWNSTPVAAEVKAIARTDSACLVRDESAERFDVLPLLVATDGAIAAFGHDYRRLRPNLVIGGVEGLGEREWPGGCLRVGKVLSETRSSSSAAAPAPNRRPQRSSPIDPPATIEGLLFIDGSRNESGALTSMAICPLTYGDSRIVWENQAARPQSLAMTQPDRPNGTPPSPPTGDPPPPSPALLAAVAKMAPVGARVPARSLLIVTLIACAYPVWRFTTLPLRPDFGTLPITWLVGVGALWLAGFIVPLALAILPRAGQVVPDGERAARTAFMTALGLICVGLFLGIEAFSGERSPAPGSAELLKSWRGCVTAGLKVSIPTIVAGALILRHVAIVDSWRLGAAVGAAGGSLAGLTLHLGCANGSSTHVALAHGGGVVMGAILGAFCLPLLDRTGR